MQLLRLRSRQSSLSRDTLVEALLGHVTQMLGTACARLLHETIEMSVALLQQLMRMTQLDDTTRIHDQDTIRIHDRVQAMRNGQHRAVGELGVYRLLDKLIRAAKAIRISLMNITGAAPLTPDPHLP